MAFGPELVFAQSFEISDELSGSKVRRAESHDAWLALVFSCDRVLLFSWDAELYGVCRAFAGEVRELVNSGRSRPPILGAVRSHLVGAELVSCVQENRDRVIRLTFRRAIGAGFYQTRSLLAEVAGRYSNLMILDEDDCVLEAVKHIHPDMNRYRSILPGHPYVAPPAIEGLPLEDFSPLAPDALDTLGHVVGLGRPLVAGIACACAAAEDAGAATLAGVAALADNSSDIVYQALGKYVTRYPSLLAGAEPLPVQTALDAARFAVVMPLIERNLSVWRKRIGAQIDALAKRNGRKIAEYERIVADEEASARLMRYGQLILANSWRIPPRAASAELIEWTEEGEVCHNVPLDPAKDPSQNAERYFARYKKSRVAVERAKASLPRLYLERDELQEQTALMLCHTDTTTLSMLMEEISPARAAPKGHGARKKEAAMPPHRRYAFSWADALLFCGLSARGNHYVTYRLARPDDIWLHAQGIPGAHVILRYHARPDASVHARMIEIAASCAAYHSKAGGGGRIRVDYTERRHVRAIPGGGPAHVTYREFSTVQADGALWREALESGAENLSDRAEEA